MSAHDRILNRVSIEELERRWKAARAAMAERGIEALVMQNTNDWLGGYVRWFTDIPANNGYPRTVIFHADGPMGVVEMGAFGGRRDLDGTDEIHRNVGEMRLTPSFLSINYTYEYDVRLAIEMLRHRGYGRIGIVGGGALPHAFMTALGSAFPDAVDATDLVDAIKAVKSPEEQALIRACALMQDQVLERVLATIRPGMRDIDVTALAQQEGQVRGSEQGIFLGSSAPLGRASNFAPRYMQGRTLEEGDHLSLLIENNGPGGFYCEIARTMVLGRASAEVLDGFAAVREAQTHTLGHIRPGGSPAAVAAAHDRYMQERGMPAELRLYAHGQGYDMVERPMIRADETLPFQAGMCLAVHPGFQTPSLFAVICDNYLIGDDGPGECLHRTEKKVFEL